MFKRPKKIVTTSRPLDSLTPIESAMELLSKTGYQQLYGQIKSLSLLEDRCFEDFKHSIILKLIDYCQSLSDASTASYSASNGLLECTLNRTEIALSLFQTYLIPDEQGHYSDEQKLWQYALCSAAMLQGVGKLYSDYSVSCFDINGQPSKLWNPLIEPLVGIGAYYSYVYKKPSHVEFRQRLNILLAKEIMPTSGFAWLSANPQVFQVWLALLNEDEHRSGTLGAILIRANALAIQRYLADLHRILQQHRTRPGRAGTFSDQPSAHDLDRLNGLEFIAWLQKSLDSGLIMINKAPLLSLPGGLLICPEIFKLFITHNSAFKNWQAIQKGFFSLDVRNNGELCHAQDPNSDKILKGKVVENYAVLLPDNVWVHTTAGEDKKISTLNFINNHSTSGFLSAENLQILTAHNQWEQKVQNISTPTKDFGNV